MRRVCRWQLTESEQRKRLYIIGSRAQAGDGAQECQRSTRCVTHGSRQEKGGTEVFPWLLIINPGCGPKRAALGITLGVIRLKVSML
jgi:hypothetical protein